MVLFLSAVGDDILGQVFLSTHREMGVDNVVVVKDSQTPVANLFMENGDVSLKMTALMGPFLIPVIHCQNRIFVFLFISLTPL